MDANALEKMDDFFDFAALDGDAGLEPICSTVEENHEPSFPTDHIAAMDWTADSTALTGYLDPNELLDTHLHTASERFLTGQDEQQWPLFSYPERSISSVEDAIVTTRAECGWQADTYVPGMDQVTHCDEPIPAPAPSSSLFTPREPAASCEDDEGDLIDTRLVSSPSQHGQSIAETAAVLDIGVPSATPVAPLRQASTASWKPASAKRKGPQSRIPFEARQILEDEFAVNPYPHNWEMDIIAHQANLDVKKVRNWFNNTRARKKGGGECLLVASIVSFAY